MEERILGHPNVDEGRLEARFEVLNLALEDAADEAVFPGSFDFELLEITVYQMRNAQLQRFRIDDNFAEGRNVLLDGPNDPLNNGLSLGPFLGLLGELSGIYIDGWRFFGWRLKFLLNIG